MQRGDRFFQDELRDRGSAGGDGFSAADRNTGEHIGGRKMQMNGRPVVEAMGFRTQHAYARIDALGRLMQRFVEHPVAAMHSVQLDAGQIERATLACVRFGGVRAASLNSPHAHRQADRRQRHPVTGFHAAVENRPGHHRAEPPDREDAIDGQPEGGVGSARGHGARERGQRLAERRQAFAGLRGDGQDRGPLEEGAPQDAPDVLPDQLEPVGLGQIRLGEHDDAASHPVELADREVLARLRHHALVRRDDQHDEDRFAQVEIHRPTSAPSPGTPGEGRGEGLTESRIPATPSPKSSPGVPGEENELPHQCRAHQADHDFIGD